MIFYIVAENENEAFCLTDFAIHGLDDSVEVLLVSIDIDVRRVCR